jgi:hypothetical protein
LGQDVLASRGSGQKGWFGQIDDLERAIGDEAARRRVRTQMLSIGRRIAAEWSKESAYRKIHSTVWQGRPNLMDWGRRLQRAVSRDGGDGQMIEQALAAIEQELNAVVPY